MILNKTIKRLKSSLDTDTFEIFSNSSKSFLVKIVGLVSSFLVSIYLAKNIGVVGIGTINLANKLGAILIIVCLFGFQQVIIKYVSIYKSNKSNEDLYHLVRISLIFNGILSIVIALIGSLLLPHLVEIFSDNSDLYYPLLIAFFMLVPQTLARVISAALNGYGKIWQSSLVDQTLSPILVIVGFFFFWIFDINITIIRALLLYALSRFIQLIVIWQGWKYYFKFKAKNKISLKLKPFFKMGSTLFLVTGASALTSNIDSIMLGSLGTLYDLGLYSIAARLALLSSIFLFVTNAAIGPKIAFMYQKNLKDDLSKIIKNTTLGLILIAILTSLIFFLLGDSILSLWGDDFIEAYPILIILCIGQFVNISTGCSGLLLTMTGNEKVHGYISFVSLFCNIFLNIILIKSYGATGAAIATMLTVSSENIIKLIFAKQKTGVSILKIKWN